MNKSIVNDFINQVLRETTYEGAKQSSYNNIKTDADRIIFSLISNNENIIMEWGTNSGLKNYNKILERESIVYLLLITSIAHEDDIAIIEDYLTKAYANKIDGVKIIQFLQNYLDSIGASLGFREKSLHYIRALIKQ